MKETYYFPHDYNAIQDPKMMELLSATGLSGIGFYWIIIEILHQQDDGCMSKTAFDGYLKFYFSPNTQEGEHLLNKIEQMLFKTELLFNNDGLVYSKRVLANKAKRDELSQKRSIAGKISAEKRHNSVLSTSVEQVSTSVQQGKERKGNKKKGNNIDVVLPFASENFKKAWEDWVTYRHEIKKELTTTAINKQLAQLAALSETVAINTINKSITSGWQGLFPPEEKKKRKFFEGIPI